MRINSGLRRQGLRWRWLLSIGFGIGGFLLLPPAVKQGIGAPIDRAGKSADLDHAATESVLRTQDAELRNQNLAVVNRSFPNPHLRNLRIVLPQDDEAYEIELRKGRDLLRRRNYEEALKSFKRANEMRGKKSPECFFGMAQAYFGLDAFKSVIENCEKAVELGGNDNDLLARAYNLKGLAFQMQAEGKDKKKLLEAENVFRQAMALNVNLPILFHNLGVVLLQQRRDPEGIAELEKYVKQAPDGDLVKESHKMIANPRRAREPYAPDFSIVTAEGEHLTLEDLRGKVVVLDFWGTWCPPCVASVPALRSLNKKYTKEPSFVLIGISCNDEEERWREFTASNKMIWPQYRDHDNKMKRAFQVNAFPTYIVIDHEGILRYRASGSSWERSAYLEDAIKKYVKIVAKAEVAN